MGIAITNAKMTIKTLMEAGFKSTSTAIAELVDNSLEAKAETIRIIATNKKQETNGRMIDKINEIAVLDDGEGMDHETLSNCVSLGWGTRVENYLKSDEGLGRFGFGLKGSSISQCRILDVYSWQNGIENCKRMTMNINEIFDGNLEELPEAVEDELPILYRLNFKEFIKDSGTLVRWRDLRKVNPKKTPTLAKHINDDFCRIYRHFLDNDDNLGKKRDVSIVTVDNNDKNYTIIKEEVLYANDPLYILTPSNAPGYRDEEIFTEWEHQKLVIEGLHGPAEIEIKCTVAKPEIQAMGGNSHIGRHCEKNTGISFVRSGREIDLDGFNYLDRSEPRHRWWGIEVRFPPSLDEIFGVTNNKQHVRNVSKLSDSRKEDYAETIEEKAGDIEYYIANGLTEINRLLEENISKMMAVIKSRAAGKRSIKPNEVDINAKVNDEVEKDKTSTYSDIHNSDKSDDEKKKKLIEYFQESDTTLNDKEAEDLATRALSYKVDLHFKDWPGKLFLDLQFPANGAVGVINRNHQFYDDFWDYLSSADDKKGLEALEIILMAYVRAEDELIRKYDKKYYSDLRDSWGRWCADLLPLAK